MDIIFRRVAFIYKLFILITLCVVGKIIYIQFINPTKVTDDDIAYKIETTQPNRGDILASDGRALASSIPYYKIAIDCSICNKDTFNKNVDALSKKLSEFFNDKSSQQYKDELIKARRAGKRYKVLGNRLVDYSEMETIRTFPILKLGQRKGGFTMEEIYKRNTPYGRLGRVTIGFINYSGVGIGIEGSFDYYLKGTPGKRILQRMPRSEFRPINSDETIEPINGYDIQTTIDVDLQEAAEKAMRNRITDSDIEGATAIVMEVKTGAIRAIVNLKNRGDGVYDESYNYAVREATEPGSTFKVITLTSLLEDGYVTLDTPIDGTGGRWTYYKQTFSDSRSGGYGLMTVKSALEHSSNVAYAKLAVQYYENNPKKYVDRVQSMRVGEKFNLDIKGEGIAVIHAPGEKIWGVQSLPSMAIGYSVLLTPLHTLTFYNAIANDGKMMKPYFVENYQRDGQVKVQFKPQEISGAICSKKTARLVKEALRGVVEEGTGRMMKNEKFNISGKTGTARMAFAGGGYEEGGLRRYQASFAGFFPSENPKYSAIVVLYSKKTAGNFYGATWAGPVFKEIAFHFYANNPDWNSPIGSKQEGRTIAEMREKGKEARKNVKELMMERDSLVSVVNMGLKDAVCLLENQGYKVSFSGFGKVVEQIPAAGSKIDKSTKIILRLSENETK